MRLEQALQTQKFKDERHKASLNILYTAWHLKTIISKALKPFGLTQEQYNVMRILKGKSPECMCVKDIADRMIEKGSNVPRIIDRLVVKDLVKRMTDLKDKRQTAIQLTPAGYSLLDKSTKVVSDLSDACIDLSLKEAKTLNNLLEKSRADIESSVIPST